MGNCLYNNNNLGEESHNFDEETLKSSNSPNTSKRSHYHSDLLKSNIN